MFFEYQDPYNRKMYEDLLKATGSLSNLFSENPVPYLYYRAAENIFCRAFEAENLSRGDVSADAAKDRVGIGLKTFLHNKGNTFQKVAEFNKGAFDHQRFEPYELVEIISYQRNKRIEFTKRAHNLEHMIYHLVTRHEDGFNIYEEDMDLINVSELRNIKAVKNTVAFRDDLHEYRFNVSKSTLFKRFIAPVRPLHYFNVDIQEDPFKFLLENFGTPLHVSEEIEETHDQVYLPLYSPSSGEVHLSSGLNQWNASGRARHPDELYIPIPIWIHRVFSGFFPYDLDSYQAARNGFRGKYEAPVFTLELPDGTQLEAKVCQENGKALMTNPNKALGNWLLRHVLQIPRYQLITYQDLEDIGVDSVVVTKLGNYHFRIDFAGLGSYTEFTDEFYV